MKLDAIEIRKMYPSEAEKVAEVDSYAYQNDPIPVAINLTAKKPARHEKRT